VNAYKVDAVMTVKVQSPRVKEPTVAKQRLFTAAIRELATVERVKPQTSWDQEGRARVRFGTQADSPDQASSEAAKLIKHKAQYAAHIASPDDLDVEIVAVALA
jgi:hypothetical protein